MAKTPVCATLRRYDALKKKCIAVHAACGPKDLNLPEDTRRDLIERFAGPGKRSTKDLDTQSADALLNHLRQLGAKCRSHADGPIRVSPEKAGLLAKIGALLAEQKKPWQYAHAVAQNNFGKDRVEWLPVVQLRGLIAQLAKTGAAMAARKG
jgi:phage gp16-like protein